MLQNKLLEQILCERYQNKTNKNCNCNKLQEEAEAGSMIPDFLKSSISDITSWAIKAGLGTIALEQLLSDLNKWRKPYTPPESKDRYSPSDDAQAQPIKSDPSLKTPRKTRVKEFGQASGQVISPS